MTTDSTVNYAYHGTLGAASATAANTVTTVTGGDATNNEVQTITLNSHYVASGGTFTITYSGQTTSAIAYNATAATIQAALVALSNIDTADVLVSGSLNTGITIQFQGALGLTNVAAVTCDTSSTTGYGNGDKVTLTGCTPGILRVRNRHASGAPIYFRVYDAGEVPQTPPLPAGADTYIAIANAPPFEMAWSHSQAVVLLVSADAQEYSVESVSGMQ